MSKDLRCFFSNGRLFVSQELNESLKEHAWSDELTLNAGRIAQTWGVPVEVKSSAVLDGMERKYHESLHAKAVKDMMENVEALSSAFGRFKPAQAPQTKESE